MLSIPNNVAKISQIFYEKNDEALKIHLTLENGNIKKDNIAFYFSETKPDLVITLGIKDYTKELSDRLNSFGFLLDSPILNIDNTTDSLQENKKFGKINLLGNSSLTEIILQLHEGAIKKDLADCLLSGIIIYTENFKKNITADIFETSGSLMKSGAELKKIIDNLKV